MLVYRIATKRLLLCAMACLPICGCSTPAVRQGDRVDISFDCRLQNGELAVTTRPEASVAAEPKSSLYAPRTGPAVVTVTAGPSTSHSDRSRLSLESEVVQGLAARIPGMREGEKLHVELSAEPYAASPGNTRTVQIAKVRKRKKEMRMPREEFAASTGKEPVPGDPFVQDRMVPGRIAEVTDKEVVIRFTPASGDVLKTPFGAVVVREEEDHYALDIQAEKGRLLRTGNMVGRIRGVDAESIAIDYGHPFAGERLSCDVEVVRMTLPAAEKGVVAGSMERKFDDPPRKMNPGQSSGADVAVAVETAQRDGRKK